MGYIRIIGLGQKDDGVELHDETEFYVAEKRLFICHCGKSVDVTDKIFALLHTIEQEIIEAYNKEKGVS